MIRRQGSEELERRTHKSRCTPALTGSAATLSASVESMRRFDFMRVMIVIAHVAFLASRKRASMKARSTRNSVWRSRVRAWGERS